MADAGEDENFDVQQLPGRAQDMADLVRRKIQQENSRPRGGLTRFLPRDLDLGAVPHLFDDFLEVPLPSAFKAHTDLLLEAMRQLATDPFDTTTTGAEGLDGFANSTLEQVGSAGDELDDWSGLAAEAFKVNFADKFRPVTASQFAAYQVARQAINAEASVWASVRKDLDTFSANALEQLHHYDDCDAGDWTFLLTLAGAVFTGAGVVKAGTSALDIASAGQSMASTGMDLFGGEGSTDELGLPNGSPAEILGALVEQLDRIRDEIRVQEDKVVAAVTRAVDLIGSQRDDFVLPRPALADATATDVGDRELMGFAS